MTVSIKKTVALSLLAGSMLSTPALAAEVEANVGLTTDYVWRGYTQNDGDTSASGGIDVAYDSGAYVGTWVGDVTYNGASYELDFYFGYAGEAGGLSYDVGYLAYMYPDAPSKYESEDQDLDFSEVYLTVGQGPISLSYYFLADADGKDAGDDTYVSVAYETEIGEWGFGFTYGVYDVYDTESKTSSDSSDMVLSLSKEDFTFSLISTEDKVAAGDGQTLQEAEDLSNDDDMRVVISWGTSF